MSQVRDREASHRSTGRHLEWLRLYIDLGFITQAELGVRPLNARRHRALHLRAASGMGGGALQEARRACGMRRRHAAGLVLTAIALAAAGTAIWTTGTTVRSGYKTAMHGGAAGTARARCGNDRYDGEIH